MVDNSGLIGGSPIKAGDNTRFAKTDIYPTATFFDPSAQTTDVDGIAIGDSGTKMYLGDPGVGFYQYTLSAANDLSTASYASKSFADASLHSQCPILFNPTGTLVSYAISATSIRQRTLSAAWDISTAGAATDTSFSSEVGSIYSYQFGSSGTKFYIYDAGDGYVEQYTLSTPYDPSSKSYDNKRFYLRASGFTNSTTQRSILFNSNGSKLYSFSQNLFDGCTIFSFATNWDVETLSLDGFGVSSGCLRSNGSSVGNPSNHCWASDGLSIFTCYGGTGGNNISQLSVDTAYEASHKKTLLNYTGKAVLADVSYAPWVKGSGSTSSSLGNNILTRTYVNVDSAGDRLVSEDEYLEDTTENHNPLEKAQSVNGIAVQSKTNLTVKVEARNYMRANVKYRIL